VLRDRRPAWLGKWAQWLCERAVLRYWPSIYALEREGLCPRPSADGWVLGFLQRLGTSLGEVLAALDNDPELITGPLWRIFEVVRTDRADGPHPRWRRVLHELVARGEIPRERVLDSCLDALERDFHPLQAKWFQELHAELEPTLAEVDARSERYLGLISSRVPGTAKIGLAALDRMLSAEAKLPKSEDVAQSLRPTLSAKTQNLALQGLELMQRCGERQPEAQLLIGNLALDALLHGSATVQKRGLELFESWGELGDPAVRDRLGSLVGAVAPVHRRRVAGLLEVEGQALTDPRAGGAPPPLELESLVARSSEIEAQWRSAAGVDAALAALEEGERPKPVKIPFAAVPRLDPEATLAPVAHLDELIDLAHSVFEGDYAPDELSRLADGISRLGLERPADFADRTAPLRHRLIGDSEEPALWEMPQAQVELGGLLLAWLEPKLYRDSIEPQLKEDLEPQSFESTIEGVTFEVGPGVAESAFLGLTFEIAERLSQGRAAPLTSLPTHRGGWLDPRALADRLQTLQHLELSAGVIDVTLALLRLAPEHRDEALAQLENLSGEAADAARYALGGDDEVGETESLWLAAARTRHPEDDDLKVAARFPRIGPGTAYAHTSSYSLEDSGPLYRRDTLRLVASHEPSLEETPPADLLSVRYLTTNAFAREVWAATLWPAHKDPLYVDSANVMLSIQKGQFWGSRDYLVPLLDADEPIGGAGLHFAALALGWAIVETAGLAEEIILAALGDGRLTGPELGAVLGSLLGQPALSPNRWARTLGRIAEESVLHRAEVKAALERTLAASEPGGLERRTLKLLELLHGLALDSGEPVQDPDCLERLRAASGDGAGPKAKKRSKMSTLAHELVELEDTNQQDLDAAVGRQILRARIERAERWRDRLAATSNASRSRDAE
jgi:hypothetical protein